MRRLLATIICAIIASMSLAAQVLVPAPQEVSSYGDKFLSFKTLNLARGIIMEDSASEFSEYFDFLKPSFWGSKLNVE